MKTKLQIKIMAMGLIFFLFAENHLTAQTNWVKYEGNPVLEEFGTWSDVPSPCVMFEDGIFKMWFAGGGNIGYAESTDGITWEPNEDPLIPAGNPGDWDESRSHLCVIRVNDTLKMWFSGSPDDFMWEISIGYAWSVDNIDWNVWLDPVLVKGNPGSWEENAVYQPAVYYDGNIYRMWYNGYEGTQLTDPDRVGLATSIDGINWIKDTVNNPVMNLGDPGTFFDTWIQSSCVLFLDNEYKMWFSGWDATNITPRKYIRIGYATSPNGIEWIVQNDSVEVLDVGQAPAWDMYRLSSPSVLYHEDQYKMWYSGFEGFTHRIGYAYEPETGQIENNSFEHSQLFINPNPINKNGVISFVLNGNTQVKLEIYNHQGQKVSTVLNKNLQSGKQSVIFDGFNLSSGIYFCVLKTSEGIQTTKMIKR
jgi:hypothetical protein